MVKGIKNRGVRIWLQGDAELATRGGVSSDDAHAVRGLHHKTIHPEHTCIFLGKIPSFLDTLSDFLDISGFRVEGLGLRDQGLGTRF